MVALAFSGHAAAGEGGRLAAQVIVVALHLFAAAIWLGALPPLAVFLVRLGTVQPSWPPGILKQAIRRFSLPGLFCVGILLLSGIFNAWTLVGSIPALLGTDYGKLLLVKCALLVPLLAIAAQNLRKLKPRILALTERSGAPAAHLIGRLKYRVHAEVILGADVLLIAGFMSITPPARHVQPVWPLASRWNLNLLNSGSEKIRRELTQAGS